MKIVRKNFDFLYTEKDMNIIFLFWKFTVMRKVGISIFIIIKEMISSFAVRREHALVYGRYCREERDLSTSLIYFRRRLLCLGVQPILTDA